MRTHRGEKYYDEVSIQRRRHKEYRKTNSSRYQCTLCDKAFFLPSALRDHERTHTGSRPFKCPIKGCRYRTYGFTQGCTLRRHFKTKHKQLTAAYTWEPSQQKFYFTPTNVADMRKLQQPAQSLLCQMDDVSSVLSIPLGAGHENNVDRDVYSFASRANKRTKTSHAGNNESIAVQHRDESDESDEEDDGQQV